MYDCLLRAFDRIKGTANQMLARLHKNLNRHILRNTIFLDQAAAELKLRICCGWKPDFNLLKANTAQKCEKF